MLEAIYDKTDREIDHLYELSERIHMVTEGLTVLEGGYHDIYFNGQRDMFMDMYDLSPLGTATVEGFLGRIKTGIVNVLKAILRTIDKLISKVWELFGGSPINFFSDTEDKVEKAISVSENNAEYIKAFTKAYGKMSDDEQKYYDDVYKKLTTNTVSMYANSHIAKVGGIKQNSTIKISELFKAYGAYGTTKLDIGNAINNAAEINKYIADSLDRLSTGLMDNLFDGKVEQSVNDIVENAGRFNNYLKTIVKTKPAKLELGEQKDIPLDLKAYTPANKKVVTQSITELAYEDIDTGNIDIFVTLSDVASTMQELKFIIPYSKTIGKNLGDIKATSDALAKRVNSMTVTEVTAHSKHDDSKKDSDEYKDIATLNAIASRVLTNGLANMSKAVKAQTKSLVDDSRLHMALVDQLVKLSGTTAIVVKQTKTKGKKK